MALVLLLVVCELTCGKFRAKAGGVPRDLAGACTRGVKLATQSGEAEPPVPAAAAAWVCAVKKDWPSSGRLAAEPTVVVAAREPTFILSPVN